MVNIKKNICVIIPTHKSNLTPYELISLNACKKQLNVYDCYLVYPNGMDTNEYTTVLDTLILSPVNPKWLSNIENYNRMKINIEFYYLFKKYTHLITYELDAYIFNSELNHYPTFLFDFIGAPLFENYINASYDDIFIKGCNSGFSVRNVQSCINVLQNIDSYYNHWKFYCLFCVKFPILRSILNRLTMRKYEIFLYGELGIFFGGDFFTNEDMVWSRIVPRLFPFFKVADSINASKFSFEFNPYRLFQINDEKLPLGCHAWHKNLLFWQKFIPESIEINS